MLLITIAVSISFGETGYITGIHQPTELESCTNDGQASSKYTYFTLQLENTQTYYNYCFDGSAESGKRMAAYVLLAFSSGYKVNVVRRGTLTTYANIICGGSNISGYYRTEYIDVLKN
jgi:hypothetical protein